MEIVKKNVKSGDCSRNYKGHPRTSAIVAAEWGAVHPAASRKRFLLPVVKAPTFGAKPSICWEKKLKTWRQALNYGSKREALV